MLLPIDPNKTVKNILTSNKYGVGNYLIYYTDATWDCVEYGKVDSPTSESRVQYLFDKYELVEIGFTPVAKVIRELKVLDNLRETTIINIDPASEQNIAALQGQYIRPMLVDDHVKALEDPKHREDCWNCSGTGKFKDFTCPRCNGTGKVKEYGT